MLEEKTIKENLKIENGKPYAVFSFQEGRRKLDGCQLRSDLANQILNKRNQLENINKEKNKIVGELTELLEIDNKLVGIGCCNLAKPIYKVIDGLIQKDNGGIPIIDHYTHDEFCSHKGD